MTAQLETEVLVVGAGLAGLFLALRLAPRRCVVLSPAPLGQAAASAWAQGGLAAALRPGDSAVRHAADTVAAGAGLVDPAVALLIAQEAPARVDDLLALGVPFDRTAGGELALSLEAAHSQPRVVRVAGDLAGRAIMRALADAARAASHITLLEGVRAVALLEHAGGVTGVLTRSSQGEGRIFARETVLAAGGCGGLFRITTNPREARGAALAQAFRAGAVSPIRSSCSSIRRPSTLVLTPRRWRPRHCAVRVRASSTAQARHSWVATIRMLNSHRAT